MSMNDRPVLICGKCEALAEEVRAENHPLSGSTTLVAHHHGRIFRRSMYNGDIANIVASNTPALDVCGWPQELNRHDHLPGQLFTPDRPPLYCGRCEMLLTVVATDGWGAQVGGYVSRDFALRCHTCNSGRLYTLNLTTKELHELCGTGGGTRYRLDVCDKNGKRYMHRQVTSDYLHLPVWKPGSEPAEGTPDHDYARALNHGVDLRVPQTNPSGVVQSIVVAGVRYYWCRSLDQYVSTPPNVPAAAGARHVPDPVTGLSPAAQESLDAVVLAMIERRLAGGPVEPALETLAKEGNLPEAVMARLYIGPGGMDMRKPYKDDNGRTLQSFNIGGQPYWWNRQTGCYEKGNAANGLLPPPLNTAPQPIGGPLLPRRQTVVATLPPAPPAVPTLPSNRGRRIVFEEDEP